MPDSTESSADVVFHARASAAAPAYQAYAFPPEHVSECAPETLHEELRALNAMRLEPRVGTGDWRSELTREHHGRTLEAEFLEREAANVAERANRAPTDATAFVAWFEHLEEVGPGQHDPLFDHLAERASSAELSWFLAQEVAGEAGFDDLVALTQVKMPVTPKLELARNYWDEMGRGRAGNMHGAMLETLARNLDLSSLRVTPVWEAVALGNLLCGLAANRAYAYHSIGALGAIELTAPGRARRVSAGLARIGVSSETRRYFALHATLDVKHSEAWNREVLHPLVSADSRVASAIAAGALMRLEAGARCFTRYRRELGLPQVHAERERATAKTQRSPR